MDRVEKTIVISFLTASVVTFLWITLFPEHSGLGSIFTYSTYGLMFILIANYIFKMNFSIYSVLLILLAISLLGHIAKIQHLPGAGILKVLVLLPYLLVLILLVWTGIKSLKSNTGATIYNFILAIIFLSILLLGLVENWLINFYKLLNYTLVATILTMKIKSIVLNKSEDKVLTVFVLLAIVPIINDTVRLIF